MTQLTLSLLLTVAIGVMIVLNGCSTNGAKPSAKTDKLEPYECGTVNRIHTLGGVFLASQPRPEDFQHAKEGGIKVVVNLRQPSELDWDEEKLVRDLGMEYHNFPFQSPAALTDQIFDDVRELLNDTSKRPLLLHCSSANRVAAVWIAHRVLDGGLSFDQALAEAKIVGLKLPAYADRAQEYIDQHRE